jgi:DNA helicase-2/ATP-dependent DNA helicase PcrA
MKMHLNEPQQKAVLHDEGPVLVLAGAGSGKTRVLTQRIIRLITENKVSPWGVLAVTFTNKAAREMKNRIVRELGEAAQDLWVSTFHSTCLRILRRHSEALGFESGFAIYDTSDQKVLVKQILKAMDLSDQVYRPQGVLKQIDRAKNNGWSPEQFVTENDHYLEVVKKIYAKYQDTLLLNQAMDFGDLIAKTIELFTSHPEILEHYQNQFQYILIDEYQDTNPVQYQLVKMLTGKHQNLFVVGDEDQSIYKFRGADIRIILGFQKDFPGAEVIKLEQNYRSTQHILNASNAVIGMNSSRLGKELWTDESDGDKVKIFQAGDDRDEARLIAGELKKLSRESSWNEMAIFYRTNAQTRVLEDALRRERIPYKLYGGMRFYDRAEIKDILAYLKILINPADSLSIKRVLNVPARGIGQTSLKKFDEVSSLKAQPFWQTLSQIATGEENSVRLVGKAKVKLAGFVKIIQTLAREHADMSLVEFLPLVYEKTGYWEMLTADGSVESISRRENLNELVNVAQDFLEMNPSAGLPEFLDQVSLASDTDQGNEEDSSVTLMTVHLAKGLEFPYVFLTGVEEGLFPHSRSLDREDLIEEERRLCYVGMTRAMKKLTFTCARSRRLFGSPMFNPPSRFMSDLPADAIEQTSFDVTGAGTTGASRWQNGSGFQKSFSSNSYRGNSYGQQKKSYQNYQKKKPQPARENPGESYVDLEYTQSDAPFNAGQNVQHQVFGLGRVKSFEGSGEAMKVVVKFQSGIEKKLSLKHANLRMVG